MPTFDPQALARWTAGTWTRVPASPLEGFTQDTRRLTRGQVFVALHTPARDGHAFLPDALAAGASAALVAVADETLDLPQLVVPDPLRAWQDIAREHRRAFGKPVVGITGSAGKTSTKNLLALLLGDRVLATEGNLNNHLGVPLTLTRLDAARHDFAVIEAGISAPGEMTPLARMIEPDVAIVTLVGNAHTAELGGLAGVAVEKAVLPAATRSTGVAVFPEDCRRYAPFRSLGVRVLSVRRGGGGAVAVEDAVTFDVTHQPEATEIALWFPASTGVQRFTLRRVSEGMAQNAVLAICAARWLGVGAEALQRRLRDWAPAKWRGEIREDGARWYYLDCYNANPDSMHDALAAFAAQAPAGSPRLYVLGNMEELGPDAGVHHRRLGEALGLRAEDHLCAIGTDAAAVCAGALAAGARPGQVEGWAETAEASRRVREWRGAVLVKGSRRYQLETLLAEAAGTPVTARP